MCTTCGCGLSPLAPRRTPARVNLETAILAANDKDAVLLRQRFAEHGTLALNLVSSPGSGKTTLLVATIQALQGQLPLAVIEGDQQTSLDRPDCPHFQSAAARLAAKSAELRLPGSSWHPDDNPYRY